MTAEGRQPSQSLTDALAARLANPDARQVNLYAPAVAITLGTATGLARLAAPSGVDRLWARLPARFQRPTSGSGQPPAGTVDVVEAHVRQRLADDRRTWATALFDKAKGMGYGQGYVTFAHKIRNRGL